MIAAAAATGSFDVLASRDLNSMMNKVMKLVRNLYGDDDLFGNYQPKKFIANKENANKTQPQKKTYQNDNDMDHVFPDNVPMYPCYIMKNY